MVWLKVPANAEYRATHDKWRNPAWLRRQAGAKAANERIRKFENELIS